MKAIMTTFLRGLAVLLPIALTLYLFYFLATASENLVGGLIRVILPESWYWPGFGLFVSVILIFVVGLVVSLPGFRIMVVFADWLFNSIPVVRSVYSTLKDFIGFLSNTDRTKEAGKPVLVQITESIQLVGMVTSNDTTVLGEHEDHVLVYLPMSYQIGGFTVLVPKEKLQPLDMNIEEAMSFVVTAGVRKSGSKG